MAIMVQYPDTSYGFEENRLLDELILHKRIVAFRRAGGWVDISRDPIRGSGFVGAYCGVERRRQAADGCISAS